MPLAFRLLKASLNSRTLPYNFENNYVSRLRKVSALLPNRLVLEMRLGRSRVQPNVRKLVNMLKKPNL